MPELLSLDRTSVLHEAAGGCRTVTLKSISRDHSNLCVD